MDNKEIVLFDRSIRVTSNWYVCVSDAQCAINESRNRVGLKRYNFSQWLKTLYVSDMVCSINESGKDALKVEFDNDSGKIEQRKFTQLFKKGMCACVCPYAHQR